MKSKIMIQDFPLKEEGAESAMLGTEDDGRQSTQGWEACFDDAGNLYYFSEELGESRWEAPAIVEELPPASQDESEGSGVGGDGVDFQISGGGGFELCHDEHGNQYLFSETGESQWLESGYEFDPERQQLRDIVTGEWKAIGVAEDSASG